MPLHSLHVVAESAAPGALPEEARKRAGPHWNPRHALALAVLGFFLASCVGGMAVDYVTDIKPLFRERCYACHGALKQKAKLRLDTVAWMTQGGETGPVLRPGDAGASRLVARIEARDSEDRMPPEHEGELLSPEQIGRVRAWIDAGAVGPDDEIPEANPKDHWAFQPVIRPPLPEVENPEWVRNPIDAFIAAKHDEQGLTPADEAPRSLLVRRLHIDLLGLPPTEDEMSASDQDRRAGWYERLVDKLLDDPRHGERWARHWMDVWRYSDWWGLGDQLRNSQRHIWHWRDWIVESLNADAPYDAMIRRMLAADESHPGEPEHLRATGYLARNYFLFNRNQWMDEVVEHVGKGFLGLTLNCAKCHDHKYDPVSQVDYTRIRAFFEPYHVRLDRVPGVSDLGRDGMPRAFDGLTNAPTYRFVRGQESMPDMSREIPPGVPEFLRLQNPSIEPIALPLDAWQPERRPWVFAADRDSARAAIESAQTNLDRAREEHVANSGGLKTGRAWIEAEASLAVAEQRVHLARAESADLECRMAAMRASWRATEAAGESSDDRPGALEEARTLARQAVQAERETAVARARLALATAQAGLVRSADGTDTRTKARAERDKARAALEKALTDAASPLRPDVGDFTRLSGAVWTPTRFLDSTKDDPRVEFGPTSTGRRKALAEWITDPRHPLTARVGVNHLWNRHLGVPLVASVFDFGRKGTAPSHRELLDWLAAEWVEHGWSMKHLHRLIVTSATYRMDSGWQKPSTIANAQPAGIVDPADPVNRPNRDEPGGEPGGEPGVGASAARDPDNRWLWRREPIRLEAEVVRDAILAHAGELDPTRGGPPVAPSDQAASKRRSLYFFHSNNDRNLFLTTFDEATVKECYRRETSIVPQQALALSNSGLALDAARRIARRLGRSDARATAAGRAMATGPPMGAETGDGDRGDAAFVRRAFRVLLNFEPGGEEVEAGLRAMASWRDLARKRERAAAEAPADSDEPAEPAEDEARAGLVWALLNHNDFVTLR